MNVLEETFKILIRPFAKPIQEIAVAVLSRAGFFEDSGAHETLERIISPLKIPLLTRLIPKPPKDVPKTAEEQEKRALEEDKEFTDRVTDVLIIEAGTAGLVDIAPSLYLSTGGWRAMQDRTVQTFNAPFSFGLLPQLQRKYYAEYTPLIPEPYRLARAAARGVLANEKYLEAMKENGYVAEWAAIWKDQELAYPTLETALTLIRRGKIAPKDFTLWLTRQGVPADVIPKVLSLTEVIPPLSDMIRFAVREAYGTHKPEEQYTAYEADAALMGLTKTRASQYWYSHWERIPLNLMYRNLWRGYWDFDELERMLKIADIHPDDREPIMRVAFDVPTIRELGYGYDTGDYTKEDIRRYREWAGLSPADAEKATSALIAYRTEAEREAVRRAYLRLYVLEKVTAAEFDDVLIALDTNEEARQLWLWRGDLELIARQEPEQEPTERVITKTEALYAFENGLKGEEWLRTQLTALDYTEERISTILLNSQHKLAEQKAKADSVEYRQLTLTQIRQLYSAKLINTEQLGALLLDYGYDKKTGSLVQDLIVSEVTEAPSQRGLTRSDIANLYEYGWYTTADVLTELLNLNYDDMSAVDITFLIILSAELPTLKTRYKNGWITSKQVYTRLLEIGVPDWKASEVMQTLIKSEQPERVAAERDLTKAEIVKGVKVGVITPYQGRDLLMDLGYEEWEAWFIMGINKVVAAGDPEGYWEMRWIVEAAKRARGEKAVEIPDIVLTLETELKGIKERIVAAKAAKKSASTIAALVTKKGDIETKMRDALKAANIPYKTTSTE